MKKALSDFQAWIQGRSLRGIGFTIAAVAIVLDQISKNWILYVYDLPSRSTVNVLPIFDLTMVWNQGVSFGLFSADTILGRSILVLFALGVVALLVRWLLEAERHLFALALGLVIGGALGNAIDRMIYGAVVDFLDFSRIYFFYVFNVADAAISVGVVLLVWDALFAKQRPEGSEDSPGSDQSKHS